MSTNKESWTSKVTARRRATALALATWAALWLPVLRPTLAHAQQCPCRSDQPNVLDNPGFDDPGVRGRRTENYDVRGASSYDFSAADHWTLYLNSLGNIFTEHLPANSGGARGGSMRVRVTSPLGGIVQYFGPGRVPDAAVITARVYVVKGQVALGAGDGGSAGLTEVSTTTGAWEIIRTAESNRPVTEVALYSTGGAAEFIVDEIRVQPCNPQASTGTWGSQPTAPIPMAPRACTTRRAAGSGRRLGVRMHEGREMYGRLADASLTLAGAPVTVAAN